MWRCRWLCPSRDEEQGLPAQRGPSEDGLPWRLLLACLPLDQRNAAWIGRAECLVLVDGLPLWSSDQSPDANELHRVVRSVCDKVEDLRRLARLLSAHARAHPNDQRVRPLVRCLVARIATRVHCDWSWPTHCVRDLLRELTRMGLRVSVELGCEAMRTIPLDPRQVVCFFSEYSFRQLFREVEVHDLRLGERALWLFTTLQLLDAYGLPDDLDPLFWPLRGLQAARRRRALFLAHRLYKSPTQSKDQNNGPDRHAHTEGLPVCHAEGTGAGGTHPAL